MSVFKGTKNFYNYEASDILAYNLKSWLEYGLLETGAYTTAKFDLPTSGLCTLKSVHDDRYNDGTVYEGMGPSWAWETDVSSIGTDTSIFRVSGVYVAGTFYPTSTTSGQYAHIIDYNQGRVLFNSPVIDKTVKCEYVFRDIGVYTTDSRPFKTIVSQYIEKYQNLDTLSPSGMAAILKENRVWLPSVFIQVQDRTNSALQLGGGEISKFAVFYHIFSDRSFSNKKIIDILNNQETKVLNLFDINNIPFNTNHDGSIASGALTYKQLSDRQGQYFWTYGHISSSKGGERDNLFDVFRGDCIQEIEIERYLSSY